MSEDLQLTIYLDLDGVCCRFVESAFQVHGREFDSAFWPAGEYDIAKVLGITAERFWRVINQRGAAFWRELEEYPWFESLYVGLSCLGRVYFVSSPCESSCSAAGKMLWLQDRFGEGFQDYILTRQKHLLSRRDAVLIDDCDDNVKGFNCGSGRGILFPQIWNSGYKKVNDDPVDFILGQIIGYLTELSDGR